MDTGRGGKETSQLFWFSVFSVRENFSNHSVSAHFPPVTPFLPLDSKNKEEKLFAYLPPSLNLVKSFLGLALNIISRILQPPVLFPPLFFPFLILPWSEDYVKQGMRVKGKFSG